MKARTLVFMLCIGLMCLTGFGNTTTDPAENSTPEMFQDVNDLTVVASMEVLVNVVSEAGSVQLFTGDTPRRFLSEPITTTIFRSADLLPPTLTIEGDVGWQTRTEAMKTFHPTTYPNLLLRNPRDGLNYDYLFIS